MSICMGKFSPYLAIFCHIALTEIPHQFLHHVHVYKRRIYGWVLFKGSSALIKRNHLQFKTKQNYAFVTLLWPETNWTLAIPEQSEFENPT